MNSPLFLLVIPQNRFCEQQLFDLKEVLERESGKCRILSKAGKKVKGEGKTLVQPDGLLVDWNRYLQGKQKYAGTGSIVWPSTVAGRQTEVHFSCGK